MRSPEEYDSWGPKKTRKLLWDSWNTPAEKQKSPEEISQTQLGYCSHMWETDPEKAKEANLPHVKFSTDSMGWVIVSEVKASEKASEIAPVPNQIPVQVIHVAEVAIPVVI